MKLIYCRGCGHQHNLTAPACPSCGAPNAPAPKPAAEAASKKWVIWSYVFAVPLPILGIGIGLGIALLVKKRLGHGIGAIVLSIVMVSFWSSFWPAFNAARA
jgi:ribosomal protein L37E